MIKNVCLGSILLFVSVSSHALSLDPVGSSATAGAAVTVPLRLTSVGGPVQTLSMQGFIEFDGTVFDFVSLEQGAAAAAPALAYSVQTEAVGDRIGFLLDVFFAAPVTLDPEILTLELMIAPGTVPGVYPVRLTEVELNDSAIDSGPAGISIAAIPVPAAGPLLLFAVPGLLATRRRVERRRQVLTGKSGGMIRRGPTN